MSTPRAELKKTPLNSLHRQSGARMVDFGGWDMPVQYSGLVDEHHTVRNAVGLFDVSHMGEIEVRGPEALNLVNALTSNDAAKLQTGQIQYSGLMYEHGGFVDDILVHKVDDDHFFICVNASNQEKDYDYFSTMNLQKATVEYASERYAQIAVQGPKALNTLQKLTRTPLETIRYYWFLDGEVADIPARIARTGYTGEDGFELYIAPDFAERIWEALLESGQEFGIKPCGLGARNTLRLEAKMALYGHEIGPSEGPLEAGLGWIVKFDKVHFAGKPALEKQQAEGLSRKLAGFEMTGRGIGRDGYEVQIEGEPAGWVTSGGPSPTLSRNIGLCYLPSASAEPGQKIEILVRNQPVEAKVVPTPFYKRAK
ncbi:MAG: glycine cleavage system aminomethyltransferase GcvT [Bryobacteraceae bacterium]|nr:glycine cleavage system aminomethyltransferase GcvT [Bryobacteraceae bacterium]